LVYIQTKTFSPRYLNERRNSESLKHQLREGGYVVDKKTFRIEVRSRYVWMVFEQAKRHCDNHILMMANIKESDSTITLTLDIPGGKRRLGESGLKAAVREMYEETFVKIRRGDLDLIFDNETDMVYKATV
jgi:hypothetical protein